MAEEPQAVGGPSFIFGSAEEVAEFVPMLADINERVLPSIADATVAAELKAHVEALSAEMTARNTEAARAAHTSAKAVLDAYSSKVGADASDAADIESVGLALATADEMIGK
jgi:hypothetical protein